MGRVDFDEEGRVSDLGVRFRGFNGALPSDSNWSTRESSHCLSDVLPTVDADDAEVGGTGDDEDEDFGEDLDDDDDFD